MNITYKLLTPENVSAVLELQHKWIDENITYGVAPDTPETISSYNNDYFYIALDGEEVVGYITAEVIHGNEYNIFPSGTDYLRINDLYIHTNYRRDGIGRQLLKLVENKAFGNGVLYILVGSATKDAEAVRRFYKDNGYKIWTTEFFKYSTTDGYTNDSEHINYENLIVPVTSENRKVVTDFIVREWYSTDMLLRGETVDMTKVDGYVLFEQTQIVGLITYLIRDGICEITSLDSKHENKGIGTALLEKVISTAKDAGCRRIQLITTNDNINVIRFYQKRGFDLVGVNLGAIDRERELKPQISLVGNYGIPLRHELEFAMEMY